MNRDRLWTLQHRLAPYFFVSPFVVLFLAFMVYPLTRSILLSLHHSAGPRTSRFVGLANFRFLLADKLFWLAALNTAAFTLLSLLIQIPASLSLAMLLNRKGVRVKGAFRFAFFAAHLVGPVFVAVIFSMILSPHGGLLNRALGLFSSRTPAINWLGEPNLIMPALLLASLWTQIGFGMVYFLAALQAVDPELYEAAEVDGAGRWAKFRHVTLPGIKPVLIFMILVGTIGGFQLFELPWVLFNGAGPAGRGITIVMYLFVTGFEAGNLGYASAIGWMLVLLIMGIAILQARLTRVMRES